METRVNEIHCRKRAGYKNKFAFPTQTLHLAGDEHRPLTVEQKWASKGETVSPGAIPAEATTPGVRTSGMTPPNRSLVPKPRPPGDLTAAALEDKVLHDDNAGEDSDADTENY